MLEQSFGTSPSTSKSYGDALAPDRWKTLRLADRTWKRGSRRFKSRLTKRWPCSILTEGPNRRSGALIAADIVWPDETMCDCATCGCPCGGTWCQLHFEGSSDLRG